MNERHELVIVPLPKDEDEYEHPELGHSPSGEPIDINDPQLTEEILLEDPEADAYATSATLKIKMDMRGLLAISISVLRQGC